MNNDWGESGVRRESHSVTPQWLLRDQSKTITLNVYMLVEILPVPKMEIYSASEIVGYTWPWVDLEKALSPPQLR